MDGGDIGQVLREGGKLEVRGVEGRRSLVVGRGMGFGVVGSRVGVGD